MCFLCDDTTTASPSAGAYKPLALIDKLCDKYKKFPPPRGSYVITLDEEGNEVNEPHNPEEIKKEIWRKRNAKRRRQKKR